MKLFATSFLLVILLLLPEKLQAQFQEYEDGRIAMSMDGNSAPDYEHKWPTGDPDDWGAEAASLAIIAKLKLQDKLVHFSYNNFIEAPAGPDSLNQLKIGADGAIKRWGYDPAIFFDVTTDLEGALEQLKNEMAKSSRKNPLYFIHAGLSEFLYQAIIRVVDEGWGEALKHVYVVSHSEFNETHLRRKAHHTFSDAMAYSNYRLNYQKIKDQNGKWDPNILWNSGEDFSPWYWMRDHSDPDVQWIYERMLVHAGGIADISDAGMLYWLFTGDEDGNPEKFKAFIGDGILKSYAKESPAPPSQTDKQRLIILADIGNEPDEMQQMIHMITCANEFDIEGLIAVTGKYIRPNSNMEQYRWVTHPELFHEIIDAYALVLENLRKHAEGWPEPEALRKLVAAGQKGYGIADVGRGNSSEGSELIIKAISRDDPRPVWVVVNAGSNTLAQALVDYQASHTKDEMDAFVAKLRVFENGAQDNAGAWICNKFPDIHWIRSNYQTYAYGGPGGTDGRLTTNLGPNYWHPYESSVEGQNEWLKENVMENHGPLGDIYPERRFHGFMDGGLGFMEGGGTIPWMGLVNKGLFHIDQPSWGGWGGRFSAEKSTNFWSRHADIKVDEEMVAPFSTFREVSDHWTDPQSGKVYNNNYVPVWRWREAMYNDQICRMDWGTSTYEEANHHPVAAFAGDKSDQIVYLDANPGEVLQLDASASSDPDGDELSFSWWIYEEAGTYPGKVMISDPAAALASLEVPTGAGGKQIHLILEVEDQNSIASLHDYRRIVINLEKRVLGHESVQDK